MDYTWWIRRVEESLKLYDVLRIDHFRGFECLLECAIWRKNSNKWQMGQRTWNEAF